MSPARQSKSTTPSGGSNAGARRSSARRDEPLFTFSRDQVRALDQAAVAELGIPSIVLMEHASLGLARHALEMTPPGGGVLIVCGKGANAGDGLALARHLHVREVPVGLILAQEEALQGDAGTNLAAAQRLRIPIRVMDPRNPAQTFRAAAASLPPDLLLVDAVLGTGLAGPPRGPMLDLIHIMNDREIINAHVLSVDIPSGLDADTGEPTGAPDDAVRADRTVTFVGLKKGFLSLGAQRFLGEVHVEQIGTPRSLSERFGELVPMVEHRDRRPDPPRRTIMPGRRKGARVRGRAKG